MTCIVGLIDKNVIHMASDSEVSDDTSTVSMVSPKIAINGDYIIGVSQSIRVINVLHNVSLPPIPSPQHLSSFMCLEFVQSIADTLDNLAGVATEEKMEDGTEILVGVMGRLFVVCHDYSVYETPYAYAAIGGGVTSALGSLFSTEGTAPKSRVTKAIKAASEFSPGVKGPVQYFKFEQK